MASLQFSILKSEEFDDILKVIIEANRNTHPLLTNGYLPFEHFEKETIQIIQNSFKSQHQCNTVLGKPYEYSHGIKIDGRLVAVNIRIDLVQQYEHLKPLISNPLARGHQFSSHFSHLGIESLSIGKATYITRLSVLPEFTGRGIAKKLIYESSKYLLERGYEYSIAAIISEFSLQLMLKLGAEVVRSDVAVRKNFSYPIYIVKTDHKKVIQVYEQYQKKFLSI